MISSQDEISRVNNLLDKIVITTKFICWAFPEDQNFMLPCFTFPLQLQLEIKQGQLFSWKKLNMSNK